MLVVTWRPRNINVLISKQRIEWHSADRDVKCVDGSTAVSLNLLLILRLLRRYWFCVVCERSLHPCHRIRQITYHCSCWLLPPPPLWWHLIFCSVGVFGCINFGGVTDYWIWLLIHHNMSTNSVNWSNDIKSVPCTLRVNICIICYTVVYGVTLLCCRLSTNFSCVSSNLKTSSPILQRNTSTRSLFFRWVVSNRRLLTSVCLTLV